MGKKSVPNGIQTSRNDMFIIKPYKEENGLLFFNKLDKDWCIEKEITRPYYKMQSHDVDNNIYTYRLLKPNSYVIYPYKSIDNNIKLIELNSMQKEYPFAYKYFIENKNIFLHSEKNPNKLRDIRPKPKEDSHNEWHRYGRTQALKMGEIKQKIVVGVLSNGDKYPIDNNQTFISSGGTAGLCMIVVPHNSHYSIYYIQAILNSKILEWVVTFYGEIFRGGYFARGSKIIPKLPIKVIDFDNENEKMLHDEIALFQKELIDIQTEIDLNKENKRKVNLLSNKFEKIKLLLENNLKRLYNLSDEEYNNIPVIKELYEAN